MNKRTVRAFAFGIIFAALVIVLGYLFLEKDQMENEAKQLLEKEGYKVLTTGEYKQLTSGENNKKDQTTKEETKKSATGKKDTPDEKTKNGKEKHGKTSNNTVITYELVVDRGMTTGEIAAILKENGIIENQKDFEQYLVDVGYSTKIRVGKYKVTNQMSFLEIALLITKQE